MLDGRVAVGALEPAVGDGAVGRFREVDAVPDEVVAGVGAGAGAGHAAPRLVVVVVLALTAGAAAHLQAVLELVAQPMSGHNMARDLNRA